LDWWYGASLADPQLTDIHIVLATIDAKRNIAFQAFGSTTDAARWAVEKSTSSNVYLHPALHSSNRPKGKGSTESAQCLTAVVADLDAQSPYRSSNEGHAPDVASLRLVVADFEQHYRFPLTVIESGYGLYPCIRFKEPFWIVDQQARTEAVNLLARFAEGLRTFARRRSWHATVEGVPLAGLIRLAGTWNRKGTPRLVRFAERDGGPR
jgi:hypothetical protein